jgi:hypothetical protein
MWNTFTGKEVVDGGGAVSLTSLFFFVAGFV